MDAKNTLDSRIPSSHPSWIPASVNMARTRWTISHRVWKDSTSDPFLLVPSLGVSSPRGVRVRGRRPLGWGGGVENVRHSPKKSRFEWEVGWVFLHMFFRFRSMRRHVVLSRTVGDG